MSADPEAPGAVRRVGRYVIADRIGAGGMAAVHLGSLCGAGGFRRVVAIKRLFPQFVKDRGFAAMLRDEARIASRIQHPNVVSVLDVVQEDAELLLVMEYVHGESLATILRALRPAPVPPDVAAALAVDVLKGLHAAHEARAETGEALGVVHRDVSPQNVLVGPDGAARLVDFGVAKAVGRHQQTRTGEIKGKVAYMAPEQLTGGRVDRRADVYGASVLLWEMLTGERLFGGPATTEVALSVLDGDRRVPSDLVREAAVLDDVVLLGMAYEKDDRYPTAIAMADEIALAVRPASSSRVAEWVQSIVGAHLREREAVVTAVEALAKEADDAAPDARDAGSLRQAAPPASGEEKRRPRGAAWVLAGGGAIVVAVVAAGLVGGRAAPTTAPPPSTPSGISSLSASVDSAPPAEIRPAVSAVVEQVQFLPPIPSAVHRARQAPPRKSRADKCSPPFRVDATGVRIPKQECF